MTHVRDTGGFTLVEMLVAMTIFLVIVMVTAASYRTVVNHSGQQSKSAETLSAGIVGLEVLRSDLKQAGFGLPWSFQAALAPSSYREAQVSANDLPAAGFWPANPPPAPATYWVNSFNDAPGGLPRAIQSANTLFNQQSGIGSKYLVIKSMLTGASPAARKWTNVAFAGGSHVRKLWGDPNRDLAATDRVIVVQNLLNPPPGSSWWGAPARFSPPSATIPP